MISHIPWCTSENKEKMRTLLKISQWRAGQKKDPTQNKPANIMYRGTKELMTKLWN